MPAHKPWPFRVAILAAAQRGAALASTAGQCLRLCDLLERAERPAVPSKLQGGHPQAPIAPGFQT